MATQAADHHDDPLELPPGSLDPSELLVLAVSDIHGDLSKLADLQSWLTRDRRAYSLCVVCGDVSGIDNRDSSSGTIARVADAEAAISRTLSYLERIAPVVVWVPGNHDPPPCFGISLERRELSGASLNVHGTAARVHSSLVVIGVGGSTPARQGDVEVLWGAWPYENDGKIREIVTEELRVFEGAGKKEDMQEKRKTWSPREVGHCCREGDSLIMVTHQGPTASTTTVDTTRDQAIVSGSEALSEVVLDKKRVPLVSLMVHGHTHAGYGFTRVGRTTVLNPGSLKEGHFGVLSMRRDASSGEWKVDDVEMHTLHTV